MNQAARHRAPQPGGATGWNGRGGIAGLANRTNMNTPMGMKKTRNGGLGLDFFDEFELMDLIVQQKLVVFLMSVVNLWHQFTVPRVLLLLDDPTLGCFVMLSKWLSYCPNQQPSEVSTG